MFEFLFGGKPEVIRALPARRQSNLFNAPACSMAEGFFTLYLSGAALGIRELHTAEVGVIVGQQTIPATVVTTLGYERPTSIVLASSGGVCEGMILSPPDMGYEPLRFLRDTVSYDGSLGEKIDGRLAQVGLSLGEADGNYLRLTTDLLSILGVQIGDSFQQNINAFSEFVEAKNLAIP